MKLEEFTYVDAKILSITEVKVMKSEEIKQPLLKSFLRKKQGEEANSYVEVNAAFVEIKIESVDGRFKFSDVVEKETASELKVGQEVVLKKLGNPDAFFRGKDKDFAILHNPDGSPATIKKLKICC